jgi:hypothetical protein
MSFLVSKLNKIGVSILFIISPALRPHKRILHTFKLKDKLVPMNN